MSEAATELDNLRADDTAGTTRCNGYGCTCQHYTPQPQRIGGWTVCADCHHTEHVHRNRKATP